MKRYQIFSGAALLVIVLIVVYLLKPGNEQSYDAASDTKPVQSVTASTLKASPLPVRPLPPGPDPEKAKIRKPTTLIIEIKEEDQVLVEEEYEDPQKELDYALNKQFEAEALEIFPVHTVQTFNPLEPELYGPREDEVWIRIKVDHSKEYKDVMAQIADFYKGSTRHDEPVTVMLWVGGRPWAKFQYPPQDVEVENE